MDFELTEEQKMLKRNVRDFLAKEIAPEVDERDRQGPFSKEEAIGYIKKLLPFGFYSGTLPEEYGGMGLDYTTSAILDEELSYVWASLAATIIIAAIAPTRLLIASDELKEKFLPRIAAGELIGSGAITEPNVGSDASAIETTAVLDGDEWVINGTKTWISNGTIADICSVVAVTDKSKGPLGISMILVEREVSPYETRELHKIGWRAFPTGELCFSDCRVPKGNVLGDPAAGYRKTMQQFEIARSRMAVMATGIS